MDADLVILFMMLMIIILLIAFLAYMLSQAYIQQDYTKALLHILTGDDYASWPQKKKEMERVTENIIAVGGKTQPYPIKVPERRAPYEGRIDPEPQSYDEELSNITELNNPNWHTGIGPSEVGK